jgi:membrane peptidoglycan carboxypeptidase
MKEEGKRGVVSKITILNPQKKKKKNTGISSFLKKTILLGIIFSLFLVGIIFLWASSLAIPDINDIAKLKAEQSSKIFDKTGEVLLYNIYQNESRTSIPLDKVSENFKNALIAVEDKYFYEHNGVKVSSFLKAAYVTLIEGGKRGASTITQQVVKNTLLTNERSYERKAKEMILAYKLEKLWSKDEILGLYINEIPFAGVIYGVEEASLYYFDKHASEITLAESAYLAAMLPKPSYFKKNKKEWGDRKNIILDLMLNQSLVTEDDYNKAKKEEVEFVFRTSRSGLRAPHFVFYVIEKLEEKYGKEALRTSGMKVITTLDFKLQEKIEEIVIEKIEETQEEYGAENASVVAIEAKSGSILSMVGSRDYFDKDIDGKVNIATSKRQPGSAFKPIVYLSAFMEGYTPETVVWDVNTEFNLRCPAELPINILENGEKNDAGNEGVDGSFNDGIYTDENGRENKCYRPRNFDWYTDRPFKGPMKMKNALPESRNIPAIKTLYLVGIKKVIENARLFGIKSLNKSSNYYGLGLVLGGGEVELLNLVSTYGTFANEGIRVEPNSIIEIFDKDNESIYKHREEKRRVVDSKYVKNLNTILSDNELKYPTFGYNSVLYFKDRDVASKTGTTNDNRDSWTVGYDDGHVSLGVWVGNNDNRSAKKNPGGAVTYHIWKESMQEALKDYPNSKFGEAPDLFELGGKPSLRGVLKGGITIPIDIKTGVLATDQTPQEFIKEIVIPSYHSLLHWVKKGDPKGPVPHKKDEAYKHWEQGVLQWVSQNSDEVRADIQEAIEGLLGLIEHSGDKIYLDN